MLVGQFFVLCVILFSTIRNNYYVTNKSTIFGLFIYGTVILGLVIFCLLDKNVSVPSGWNKSNKEL